jgi:hypothetical protein
MGHPPSVVLLAQLAAPLPTNVQPVLRSRKAQENGPGEQSRRQKGQGKDLSRRESRIRILNKGQKAGIFLILIFILSVLSAISALKNNNMFILIIWTLQDLIILHLISVFGFLIWKVKNSAVVTAKMRF